MAIAFRSMSDVVGTGTSATPSEPSGTTQGDVLVALFTVDAASSGISIPAGWTSIYNGVSATTKFRYNLCYTVRGPAAPLYTFTISGGSYYGEVSVLAFSGVHTTSPIDISVDGGSSSATPANPDAPSATTTYYNGMSLAVGVGSNGSTTGGWTAPSGYSIVTGNTAGRSAVIATKALADPASENPAAYANAASGTADRWAATVVLRQKTPKPIAEYSFDSTGTAGGTLASGGLIADLTGNNNTLSALADLDIVAGKNNVGIAGDGTGCAQVSSTSAIKPTTEVTWMCWAKVTGNTYNFGQIFGRCNDDGPWGDAFSFYMDSTNKTTYGFLVPLQTDTTSHQYYNTNTKMTLNTWVHLAATWSAADGNIRIYINGSSVMTAGHTGSAIYYGSGGNTTKHFNILYNEAYNERGDQIQLDDVRVFDSRLSAGEIATWMNTPATLAPASTLTDDFTGSSYDTTKWNLALLGDTTLQQTGGELVLTLAGSGSNTYTYLSSVAAYDLRESSVIIEATGAVNANNGAEQQLILQSGVDPTFADMIVIAFDGSLLVCAYNSSTISNSPTYITRDVVNHRWWRIRKREELFFGTSPQTEPLGLPSLQCLHIHLTYRR